MPVDRYGTVVFPMEFYGRTAVVTGAAGGMGREIARQLALAGCNVALCDIRYDLTPPKKEDMCQ